MNLEKKQILYHQVPPKLAWTSKGGSSLPPSKWTHWTLTCTAVLQVGDFEDSSQEICRKETFRIPKNKNHQQNQNKKHLTRIHWTKKFGAPPTKNTNLT